VNFVSLGIFRLK